MSQPLDIAPAFEGDAAALAKFLNECTLVHQGVARSSPEDVSARLHRGGADPAVDSFVVSEAGQIVGFANICSPSSALFRLTAAPGSGSRCC